MPSAGLPRSPPQAAGGDFGPGRPPPASVPMPSGLASVSYSKEPDLRYILTSIFP